MEIACERPANLNFQAAHDSLELLGSTHSPDPRASAEAARQSLAAIRSPLVIGCGAIEIQIRQIRHRTNGQKSQRFEQ